LISAVTLNLPTVCRSYFAIILHQNIEETVMANLDSLTGIQPILRY